jgi:hypothetical protein
MSTPTEQPFATYMTTLQDALERIYGDEGEITAMTRASLYLALGEVCSGQLTTHTDVALEIARDINRGVAAA